MQRLAFPHLSWVVIWSRESSPEGRCFSNSWPELTWRFKCLQEGALFLMNRPALQILVTRQLNIEISKMPLKFYFKWLVLLAPWIIHFFLHCGMAPRNNPSTAIKKSWGTSGRITAIAVRAFQSYSGSGISARNCRQSTLNIYHFPTARSPKLRRSWSIESFGNPPVLSTVRYPCTVSLFCRCSSCSWVISNWVGAHRAL